MKTSKIIAAATLISMMALLQSCTFVKVNKNFNIETEKGDRVTRDFSVGSLEHLVFDSHADILLEMSDTPYVKAICAPNVIENLVVTEDADGKVWIRMSNKHIRYKNLEIHVGTPEIKSLEFNGAVDFYCCDTITAHDLDIVTNGASDLKIIGLEAENFSVTTNGANDIDFKGIDTKNIHITINGAGDVTIKGKSEKGEIEVNGAGDIDIREFDCPDMYSHKSAMGRIRSR